MKARPLGLALGVFALVLVGALLFLDAIRDVVVVPILYLIWLAGLVIRSFDQGCLWTVALIVALVISVTTLRRRPIERDSAPQPQPRPRTMGRIHFWLRQVQASRVSDIARETFRTELRRLVADLWAHRSHQSLEDVRRHLRQDELPLPEAVRSTLGLGRPSVQRGDPWWERLRRWVRSKHNHALAVQPDRELAGILDYLDDVMEVVDDTHTR